MTIVCSVKVRDGLILGTDSMTQISAPMDDGGVQVLKSYSNARKREVAVEQKPVLGFYVAGYTQGEPFPEEFEFLLPRDDAPFRARDVDQFGASWRGVDSLVQGL